MSPMLEQLKDIKPPVEVPDHSLWVLVMIVVVVLLALTLLTVWLYHHFKHKRLRRRGVDPKKVARLVLKQIDFSDTKRAIYTFSEAMPLLIQENEDVQKEFQELLSALEKYKYKKEVPSLTKEDKRRMKQLIRKVL